MIEAVRKNNSDLIRRASRQLEDGMMQRLISQLAARRPPNSDQMDLFAGYQGVHQFIGVEIERDSERTFEWKLLRKSTLRELGLWLSVTRKTPRTRRQRNPGMVKLLRDLSKAANGDLEITVEAAMALKKAAGEGRAIPKGGR